MVGVPGLNPVSWTVDAGVDGEVPVFGADGKLASSGVALAGIGSGGGRTVNAHAHSTAGALDIPRSSGEQITIVSVEADASSWTDNLTTLDNLHAVLVGSSTTSFDVDLSNELNGVDEAFTIHPYSIRELDVLKVGVTLVAVLGDEAGVPTPATFTRGFTTTGAPVGLRTVTVANVESANNGQAAGAIPAGSELVLIHACNGPGATASPTFTAPTGATELLAFASTGFAPALKVWTKTYATETDWGSWGSDDPGQHTVLVFPPGATVKAAAAADTDTMPAVASMPAGTVEVYVGVQNYAGTNSDAETTPPAGYTEHLDPGPGARHTFVGSNDTMLAAAGSAGGDSVGRVGDSNRTIVTLAIEPA